MSILACCCQHLELLVGPPSQSLIIWNYRNYLNQIIFYRCSHYFSTHLSLLLPALYSVFMLLIDVIKLKRTPQTSLQVPALHPPSQPRLFRLCLHQLQWTVTRLCQLHPTANQQLRPCTLTGFMPIKVSSLVSSFCCRRRRITVLLSLKYSSTDSPASCLDV